MKIHTYIHVKGCALEMSNWTKLNKTGSEFVHLQAYPATASTFRNFASLLFDIQCSLYFIPSFHFLDSMTIFLQNTTSV